MVVLAAMAAGVSTGAGEAATSAVKDAYAGLRTLVLRRFAGDTKAEKALTEYEDDPETHEQQLVTELVVAGAHQDDEIRQSAEEVLRQAHVAGVRTKYQVQVQLGGKVGVIGDNAHVDRMNL